MWALNKLLTLKHYGKRIFISHVDLKNQYIRDTNLIVVIMLKVTRSKGKPKTENQFIDDSYHRYYYPHVVRTCCIAR